ncbi:MAG: GGDEF domain-containing protein [Eubacterium sp.]|nr:GGDEF domain-containing protein [Eubacterium sp.]
MEEYKLLIQKSKFLRIRIESMKDLTVHISIVNEKSIRIPLEWLCIAEDLPELTEEIRGVASGNTSELYTHFRINFDGEIRRFLICAQNFKDILSTRTHLDGIMIEVSKYIDKAISDVSGWGFILPDSGEPKICDLVNREYLEQLQMPFKFGAGIYSAIFDADGKLLCTPNSKEASFNINKFPFLKEANIRVNRMVIAKWIIGAYKKEIIDKHEQLLDVMSLTLSRVVNSLVLLYKEMTNSQHTNKMLSENVEQQMLINSVYNESFGNKNTSDIINTVFKIVGNYVKVDSISIFEEDSKEKMFYELFKWMANGDFKSDLKPKISYNDIPITLERLDFTDYYYPSGFKHEFNKFGVSHYVAANLSGEGGRGGIVTYSLLGSERIPTTQEVKILIRISQILSSLLLKYKTDQMLEETSRQATYLAYHDPTLNVPNRAKLDIDLREEFISQKEGSVVYIKVTNLRTFNELFGHSYTDMLIKSVTDYIASMPVEAIKIYRFSGNIITVLLSNADALAAKKFSEMLLIRFKRPWEQDGNEHYLEAGIGVTLYPQNGKNNEEIYRAASLSMYRSIEYGVNSYAFYSKEFEKPASVDYFFAEKLRMDINNHMNGFSLRYQPVISLKTGNYGPFEVFVNWSGENNTLGPINIVRLAENIGFDIRLDKWVITSACEFCKEMQKHIDPDFSISVNITVRELQSGAIISMVKEALRKSGLSGEYLYVEISERTLMNTRDNIIPVIAKLKEIGVKIIIDSFGRDFVAPKLLKYSYVNMVKTDFSLFTNVFDDYDEILLETVIKLSKTIPGGVCVKRVENAEQLGLLNSFNINYLQGYLLSKPLTSSELMDFLSVYEPSVVSSFIKQ